MLYLVFVKKFISANMLLKQFIDNKSEKRCRLSFLDLFSRTRVIASVSERIAQTTFWFNIKRYVYHVFNLSIKKKHQRQKFFFLYMYCVEWNISNHAKRCIKDFFSDNWYFAKLVDISLTTILTSKCLQCQIIILSWNTLAF